MREKIRGLCEALNARMQADLDKGEVPAILHEVGNLRFLFERLRFTPES